MGTVRCPQCDHRLQVRRQRADQIMECPTCRAVFSIPGDPNQPRKQSSMDDGGNAETEREVPLSRPSPMIDAEELIDMTAMVDIVFFLLIFFLVTSMSAILSSAPLPRPENRDEDGRASSKQTDDQLNDSDAIVVKINKDDSIEIDGVPYREMRDLIDRLHQLRTANGRDTSLLVVGHGDATHGAAVSILDAGYEVGINRLRFAVLGDEGE